MPTLLGLDYGSRRVGIAVSDETRTIAFALGFHDSTEDGSLFARLAAVIAQRDVAGIVIGLPLEESGTEGGAAGSVRAFAARLAAVTGLPVSFVDERYSSREAAAFLRESGRRRRPKGEVDALAAEIILQQHLDRLRAGAGPPEPAP